MPRTQGKNSSDFEIYVNRYVETQDDWEQARNRSGYTHKDFFGMPYRVPRGFVSISNLAGFPAFYSTPHDWANRHPKWDWGDGKEYQKFRTSSDDDTEYRSWDYAESSMDDPPWQYRTWVDVDPVTGRAMRMVRRMQLNYRIERSSL